MLQLHCHARDEPVAVLSGLSHEDRYRYWRGRSGRRYLHTVYALADWPGHAPANVIFVRRAADGSRAPLKVACLSGSQADFFRFNAAGANEVHVHLLAGSDSERRAVAEDLRAALLPGDAL